MRNSAWPVEASAVDADHRDGGPVELCGADRQLHVAQWERAARTKPVKSFVGRVGDEVSPAILRQIPAELARIGYEDLRASGNRGQIALRNGSSAFAQVEGHAMQERHSPVEPEVVGQQRAGVSVSWSFARSDCWERGTRTICRAIAASPRRNRAAHAGGCAPVSACRS